MAATRERPREQINLFLQAGLRRARKKVGGYDTYICPICGNGSGPDGDGICTRDGVHYKCFKCGFYGDYLDILKNQYGTDDENAVFSRFGLKIDDMDPCRSTGRNVMDGQAEDYTYFFLQAKNDLRDSPEGLRYLESRGISPETAYRAGLGYASGWKHPKRPYDKPDSRIIIPTGPGSYMARAIGPSEKDKLKVGSVEPFNLQALYGTVPAFVTEAELDAVSVEEVGGTACALGASSMVNKFLGICGKKPPSVPLILSLDNDEAGIRAQAELKRGLLALGLSVYEVNTSGKYKDPNEHLVSDRAAFTAVVNGGFTVTASPEADTEKAEYIRTSAAHHLTAFMGELAAGAGTPVIPTGFNGLDEALDGGLYGGLYIIGAISSLGKTTFALQMADQIAQRGTDVLIFSLEMSRYELMAKSISRLTYEGCNGKMANAKTTRGILAGAGHRNYSAEEVTLINDSAEAYAKYARRIYIHEGAGDVGLNQIKREVQKHITFTGGAPVVIIDYLQILAPFETGATDKQNTDKAVLELKRLSRDYKIPVIALSSFNRDNYSAPVNLASFKESGAIEYSSDVLLGFQLAGMDELSQADGKRVDAIKLVEEKKAANPRKIQLKILKNRNGKASLSVYYDYFSMFNLFRETVNPNRSTKR